MQLAVAFSLLLVMAMVFNFDYLPMQWLCIISDSKKRVGRCTGHA